MESGKIKFVLKVIKEFQSLSPGLTFESYQVSKSLFDKNDINYIVYHNKKDVVVPKDCVEFIHEPIKTGRQLLEEQKFVSPRIGLTDEPSIYFGTAEENMARATKLFSLIAEFDEALKLLIDAEEALHLEGDTPETNPYRTFIEKHGRKIRRP